MRRGIAACVAALSLAGCGYRVGAKAELMPRSVRSIAIPAFANVTPRYRLTQMLPGAIGREFITRTRYRVVADPNEADAILEGAVTNYMSAPTIFDQATGRAAGLQIIVFLNIKLVEKSSGKVLYAREGLEVRERYEVSIDQRAYFDESDAALERLSRDVARQVVSTILEAF